MPVNPNLTGQRSPAIIGDGYAKQIRASSVGLSRSNGPHRHHVTTYLRITINFP
jgi:hypothetical protein